MTADFNRIARSIRDDLGITSKTGILVAGLLLSGWGVWALRTTVEQYEVSDSARLEVAASAYPVQSSSAGRVVRSSMVLGQTVQQGDVLAELDTTSQRFNLDEEIARCASLRPQLAALSAQLAAERAGGEADRGVSRYSDAAAMSQYRQADLEAILAEQQAARAKQMRLDGIVAPAEADRLISEAQSKRALADSLKAASSRVAPELHVKEREREARVTQIAASQAKLESDLRVSETNIRLLEHELDRRRVRAPISGRIAEAATLPAGSEITEGQQLGVILPSSQLRIVAQFQPASSFGKIREGQPATMRLDGFPWAQFGVVSARVARIASEVQDGKVRVELAVTHTPRVAVQHGLPGIVEVEVERTTPAAMLLRSAGTMVGQR